MGIFAEQYLRKGVKIAVTGRIQTGRYTNKDGQTVFTTDVVVEDQEFAESKAVSDRTAGQASYSGASYGTGYSSPAPMPQGAPAPAAADDGFINIPDGIDEELPFK